MSYSEHNVPVAVVYDRLEVDSHGEGADLVGIALNGAVWIGGEEGRRIIEGKGRIAHADDSQLDCVVLASESCGREGRSEEVVVGGVLCEADSNQ